MESNLIQKVLYVLLGTTIGGVLLAGASYASAAFPPTNVSQGGTGVNAIATGTIPFGAGTTLGNSLRIATSSGLSFASTTNTLTITNGSTTNNFTVIGLASSSHIVDSELGGSGTTCVQASAAGVLSATGVGCATALSGGTVPNLAYWTSATTLGSVATSSASCGTGLSCSGFTVVGSVAPSIALSTPVSIANGGTNATAFTTSGNSVYWDGTRLATSLTTTKVTTPYASSTASTASGETGIPNAASSPTLPSGDIAIDTTAASSSLRFGDGTATRSLFPDTSKSVVFASSTLAYIGAFGASGTTTIRLANYVRPITLQNFYCKTDVGTTWVAFGTGSATTTAGNCSSTGTLVTLSSTNTWTMRQDFYVDVGRNASAPNVITITADIRQDSD